MWAELGLPVDIRFDLLDGYGDSWFQLLATFHDEENIIFLATLLELSSYKKSQNFRQPPFCIALEKDINGLYGNLEGWTNYIENLSVKFDDSVTGKKIQTACLFLGDTLLNKSNLVHQSLLDKEHRIVTEERLREAKNILAPSVNMSNMQKHMLLFWPLIDIYESLSGDGMLSRLEELGIKLGEEEK